MLQCYRSAHHTLSPLCVLAAQLPPMLRRDGVGGKDRTSELWELTVEEKGKPLSCDLGIMRLCLEGAKHETSNKHIWQYQLGKTMRSS